MSSSVHIDNKKKDILTLGKEPTQELDDTTFAVKAKYPVNFTQPITCILFTSNSISEVNVRLLSKLTFSRLKVVLQVPLW